MNTYTSKPYDIYGQFKHGGETWILIEVDGYMLKGISITPLGKIHKLHIHKLQVYDLIYLTEE